MNKVVLKEFSKEQLWIKVVFYGLFALVGFELLHFSNIGFTNPIKYVPVIYYTFAFLSLVTYFGNRIKGDYELLYFGLINVIVGTFTLVNNLYPNSGFILADAVLLYSIANVLNKGFSCNRLLREKNVNFFSKISITILLLFLGVFVVSSLYNKIEVGTLILGYYLVTFGLLSLLEPFIAILMNNQSIKKYILYLLSYEKVEKKEEKVSKKEEKPKKEESKEKPKIKNRTIKKIKKK